MNIEQLLKDKKGTIVDVRAEWEFQGGHVAGSINIPLHELQMRIDEIKAMNTPLILCCASGNRSGMATQLLQKAGIECINGGSWLDVNYYQSLAA
jgi:phage shock protein E